MSKCARVCVCVCLVASPPCVFRTDKASPRGRRVVRLPLMKPMERLAAINQRDGKNKPPLCFIHLAEVCVCV